MNGGRLTTHVLDTALGRPVAGLTVELWRIDDKPVHIKSDVTNADGRLDAPLLDSAALRVGIYELRFHVGAYLAATVAPVAVVTPVFLDLIPIRFGIADRDAHYHVPLLLCAHGYTTYRGS